MAASISPDKLAYMKAHIHESRQREFVTFNIAFSVICIIFVGLRFFSRKKSGAGLKADDYCALIALVRFSLRMILYPPFRVCS